MYKSYKYTKQTRDIFFKNIMGLLSYEKWLNRFNTQNGDLEIQSKFPSGDLEIPNATWEFYIRDTWWYTRYIL